MRRKTYHNDKVLISTWVEREIAEKLDRTIAAIDPRASRSAIMRELIENYCANHAFEVPENPEVEKMNQTVTILQAGLTVTEVFIWCQARLMGIMTLEGGNSQWTTYSCDACEDLGKFDGQVFDIKDASELIGWVVANNHLQYVQEWKEAGMDMPGAGYLTLDGEYHPPAPV